MLWISCWADDRPGLDCNGVETGLAPSPQRVRA